MAAPQHQVIFQSLSSEAQAVLEMLGNLSISHLPKHTHTFFILSPQGVVTNLGRNGKRSSLTSSASFSLSSRAPLIELKQWKPIRQICGQPGGGARDGRLSVQQTSPFINISVMLASAAAELYPRPSSAQIWHREGLCSFLRGPGLKNGVRFKYDRFLWCIYPCPSALYRQKSCGYVESFTEREKKADLTQIPLSL